MVLQASWQSKQGINNYSFFFYFYNVTAQTRPLGKELIYQNVTWDLFLI